MIPSRKRALPHVLEHVTPITEVGFMEERFKDAANFFNRINYPLKFYFICNDATCIRQELDWRPSDDALFGLNTLKDLKVGNSMQDIYNMVDRYQLCTQADVLLLCPLLPNFPSFVLAVFPQRATPVREVIAKRWSIATDLCEKYGMFVISRCSDGAPSQLAAMLHQQCEEAVANDEHQPKRSKLWSKLIPAIDGNKLITTTSRYIDLNGRTIQVPDLHWQDFFHEAAKFRTRFTGRDGAGLRLGNGLAKVSTLRAAIQCVEHQTEAVIGLRVSDLSTNNPMNVAACLRLFSEPVVLLMGKIAYEERHIERTTIEATPKHLFAFLQLCHRALMAFLDPELTPLQSLYYAFYAKYFAEIWRADAIRNGYTSSGFLTPNQFKCIVLNAESLLLFMLWLISDPALKNIPFAPSVFGSQPDEKLFRDSRAFPGDSNFGMLTFLQRISYLLGVHLIKAKRADLFIFPTHSKVVSIEEFRNSGKPIGEITEGQMLSVLAKAMKQAQYDASALGISNDYICVHDSLLDEYDSEDEKIDGMQLFLEVDDSELQHTDLLNAQSDDEDFGELHSTHNSCAPTGDDRKEFFSERNTETTSSDVVSTKLQDANGLLIHKRKALAIISAHKHISSDRDSRVKEMGK